MNIGIKILKKYFQKQEHIENMIHPDHAGFIPEIQEYFNAHK